MKNEPSIPLIDDYSIVESKHVLTIHHRLGDTLRLRDTRGLLGPQFFRDAIEKATITAKTIKHIHVHTDSPVLSRKLLEDCLPGISKSYGSIELSAANVLTSLARARHLVLSKSTMSWWAAAGGAHDTVVSPSEWDFSGSNRLNPETWKLSDPD